MKHLHIEKKGLRGLAIAESFGPDSKNSILCGIVMRQDFVIDGSVFDIAEIKGDDATEKILQMYHNLNRPDVNYLLISGLIISLYNIVDIKKIHSLIGLPVIGLTYRDSLGVEESIKFHFPNSFESKLKNYARLAKREKIILKNNSEIFVRFEGCSLNDVKYLLNKLTLQGSVPEPLRVAKILAKSLLQRDLSF